MKTLICSIVLVGLLSIFSQRASAEAETTALVPLPSVDDFSNGQGGFSFGIGLGIEYESAYEGSDEFGFEVNPAAPLNFPKWLQRDNVQLMLHHFPKHEDYCAELSLHGIQLSFAPSESFCHYHNEGRAMGAVVLALRSETFSAAELEDGVNEIRFMSAKQRSESGKQARQGYEDDRQAFALRLREAISAHLLG